MQYRDVKLSDVAGRIMEALPKGVLLTTKDGDRVNSMTIGWGMLGFDWSQPTFITFVRTGRFTNQMLQANGEFTINVPYGAFDKHILGICGSKSGRDIDKVAAAGLTLVEPRKISVPGVAQLPLTLECRVVYAQQQDLDLLDDRLRVPFYPADVDSSNPMANRDPHVAYYGEIVDAYLIEE